jgi:hypothetical protein
MNWHWIRAASTLAVMLVCSVVISGCPSYGAFASIYGTPPPSNYTGASSQIDLLVRGYLVRNVTIDPDYGYYAYLLFLDKSESTRPHRKAAAEAFVNLLDDVTEASKLQTPHEHMAILLSPAQSRPTTNSAEDLLDKYDYLYAQLLASSVERSVGRLPRVALVGSLHPLSPQSRPAADDLLVTELCGDKATVENKILRFGSSLKASTRTRTTKQGIVEKAYEFFVAVGRFSFGKSSDSCTQ